VADRTFDRAAGNFVKQKFSPAELVDRYVFHVGQWRGRKTTMVVLIIVGWALALPVLLVVGLSVAAKLLGARAQSADASVDVTTLAREFVGAGGDVIRRAPDVTRQADTQPVGSGY
jgi:hypothetical protein